MASTGCLRGFSSDRPTGSGLGGHHTLIYRLGMVSLVLFLALVRLFFSSILLVLKSYEVLGRARLGLCISLDFPFFLA